MNTNNMTRDQAERVIERLVNKKNMFDLGCPECQSGAVGPCNRHTDVEQPIMLTDVLEKAYPQVFMQGEAHFLQLWQQCGFTRSLQTILQEAAWEEIQIVCSDGKSGCLVYHCKESMKGPAKDLFEYLESLFPSNP